MTSEPTTTTTDATDPRQKLLIALLWAVLGMAMLGVIGAAVWAKLHRPDTAAVTNVVVDNSWEPFPAPAFALVDQDGMPVGSEQLKGKPYVAAFIFTNCAGACPMMTQKMVKLQQAVPDESVKLVSFTVDPERDTPEVLKKYAANAGAQGERWHFLTGKPAELAAVAEGMKMAAVKATDGSDQYIHSDRFLLIDGQGLIRGTYKNSEPEAMAQLAEDAKKLAKGGTL